MGGGRDGRKEWGKRKEGLRGGIDAPDRVQNFSSLHIVITRQLQTTTVVKFAHIGWAKKLQATNSWS